VAAARPPAAPVVVADVRQMQVPLEIHAIGNVEANSTVEVKSQVTGQLDKVFFTEGQEVRQGQLLFQLDPRQLEQAVSEAQAALENSRSAVAQAQANYERDMAQARNARSQAERYASLAEKGIISREANENYRTQADAAERVAAASQSAIASAQSNVTAASARVANARLQLNYAQIHAPISGKIGKLSVKAGNLVAANSQTPLVVIEQITPAYANFSVPEQSLSDIQSYSRRGKLAVQAYPGASAADAAEPKGDPSVGTLDFVDNRVDPTSGTILLRAKFPNTDRRLWPGQFVHCVVRLDVPTLTVIPTAAISSSQDGHYVFLVKPDLTAEQRDVQTLRDYRELTVVSGVNPGERVVVKGQLRVKPGAKVEIVKDGAQGAAGSATQ